MPLSGGITSEGGAGLPPNFWPAQTDSQTARPGECGGPKRSNNSFDSSHAGGALPNLRVPLGQDQHDQLYYAQNRLHGYLPTAHCQTSPQRFTLTRGTEGPVYPFARSSVDRGGRKRVVVAGIVNGVTGEQTVGG